MNDARDIAEITERLLKVGQLSKGSAVAVPKERLLSSARQIGRAASGSWLGYQARVYYQNLNPPPPGVHFDVTHGLNSPFLWQRSVGWQEFSEGDIEQAVRKGAGSPQLDKAEAFCEEAREAFEAARDEALAILQARLGRATDATLENEIDELKKIKIFSVVDFILLRRPKQTISADDVALSQGFQVPPHLNLEARIFELDAPGNACAELAKALRPIALRLKRIGNAEVNGLERIGQVLGQKVFIGHGGSNVWRDLKDFLQDRLHLEWDEFNREPSAGISTVQRLEEMLSNARFAFLVMTAEDEQADGKMVARQNVIHEAGLFQGKIGFAKAIILLEDGCEEFSNIRGLTQIRFPKGHISAKFEEIRRTLEREKVIPSTAGAKRKVRPI